MTQLESSHLEEILNLSDKRTMKWVLISSPMPIICLVLVYIYIIHFAGPRFMKNRQPYLLRGYMQYYNLFQIIANFWLVYNVVTNGRPFTAVWRYCDSFDKICGRNAEKQLAVIWWALLHRIIDLSDTIVFVLRKKNQQISFLHTYHHISTVVGCWLYLKYFAHGYIMTMAMINGSVHVIMYSYYFLSTYGSNMKRRLLPFKKWITVIQMVQIAFMMITSLQGFAPHCDNKVAKYFSVITSGNSAANLLLFLNFYRNSYKKLKTV